MGCGNGLWVSSLCGLSVPSLPAASGHSSSYIKKAWSESVELMAVA